MFILYGLIANSWKIIDMTVDKNEIVDTMLVCSDKYHLYDFKIEQKGNTRKKVTIIRGKEELAGYLYEYRKRIKPIEDKSCVELKRYILDKKTKKK